MMSRALSIIGLELTPTNHVEKVVSGLGGLAGILAVALATWWAVGPDAVMPVVASMGASCVLLFAVPHGPLSQPWPFAGGHLISAVIGVACARWIAPLPLAGAVSVGLAITAMYYARAIHPPGGATALTAVLGGAALRKLGFAYVAVPVGLNVGVLLAATVAFNYPLRWRRYPAALSKAPAKPSRIAREDWAHALTHVPSLADVNEDDLATLHEIAVAHAAARLRGGRAARPRKIENAGGRG